MLQPMNIQREAVVAAFVFFAATASAQDVARPSLCPHPRITLKAGANVVYQGSLERLYHICRCEGWQQAKGTPPIRLLADKKEIGTFSSVETGLSCLDTAGKRIELIAPKKGGIVGAKVN
jgi:hypothetical protein